MFGVSVCRDELGNLKEVLIKMTDEKKMETASSMSKDTKSKISKETELKAPKETKSSTSKEVIGQSSDKTEKKEDKKPVIKKKEIPKKDVAVANGFSLRVSPKQCIYVCRVIRGKSPDAAVDRLQAVVDWKRVVPMAGLEVGHKRGRGLAGGKFPKNACKAVMEIVKQAGANAIVAGIEEPVISIAKADRASAPLRKGGRKAKRCHIHIEVCSKTSLVGRAGGKKRGGRK